MNFEISKKNVEEGNIPNAELARQVWPYARAAVWFWGLTNVLIVLTSFKWLKV